MNDDGTGWESESDETGNYFYIDDALEAVEMKGKQEKEKWLTELQNNARMKGMELGERHEKELKEAEQRGIEIGQNQGYRNAQNELDNRMEAIKKEAEHCGYSLAMNKMEQTLDSTFKAGEKTGYEKAVSEFMEITENRKDSEPIWLTKILDQQYEKARQELYGVCQKCKKNMRHDREIHTFVCECGNREWYPERTGDIGKN